MNKSLAGIFIAFSVGIFISFMLIYSSENRSTISNTENKSAYPQRIICAVPNITEIVFALGQGDRVVGISEFTTYPPEALDKPKIGGYIDPNLERIISLEPDLIIVISVNSKLHSLCKERGIQMLHLEIENLQTLYKGIKTIAETLGCDDEGSRLVQSMKDGVQRVIEQAANVPSKPNVFLCLSRMEGEMTDMFTVTRDTFLGELVELAGGNNIFGDLNDRYPQISKESLLKREPDVIIELRPEDINLSRSIKEITNDWNELSSIPAVANGNIQVVTDDYIKIAGPRIVQSAERMLQLIHHHDN
jgi:iron complex transport system substrate-binding protein